MSSCSKILLDEICSLLSTYRGRDKILRTLCYTTRLVGALTKNEKLAKQLLIFSRQMSGTRTTLRLLDDLPMLKHTLEYGFGAEEPDKLMASLGVTTNIIDQLFYPIEKICWLGEHRIIEGVDLNKWDYLNTLCWVISIYLSLMRSLRYVTIMKKHKSKSSDLEDDFRAVVNSRINFELLTCARLSLDFVHAVNTLPQGFMWSSKLNGWPVALVASISSVLGIYQIFQKRNVK